MACSLPTFCDWSTHFVVNFLVPGSHFVIVTIPHFQNSESVDWPQKTKVSYAWKLLSVFLKWWNNLQAQA